MGDGTPLVNIYRVMARDHLADTGPAERGESGGDMIIFAEAGDKPCRKMYHLLQSVQAGFGPTTPD